MFRSAITLLLLFSILTGLVYPIVVTAVAQILFSEQANGSVISKNGKIIGSKLIGQNFESPKNFWGRPSATIPYYNAMASTGSNLGPSNPALLEAVKIRAQKLNISSIPIDLVTSSASGLDPHISEEAALVQIPRIAKERKLPEEKLQTLIIEHTETRLLGVLGEPRVNILQLNLALDALTANKAQ